MLTPGSSPAPELYFAPLACLLSNVMNGFLIAAMNNCGEKGEIGTGL